MTNRYAPDMMVDIHQFHSKFGLYYGGGPRELPVQLAEFRVKFMQEELDEYGQACAQRDLEGQLDALVDLVYVAMGTAYQQGLDFDEAWRRVHAANMKKVRAASADESKRGSSFDIVKPPGWTAPSHTDLVVQK